VRLLACCALFVALGCTPLRRSFVCASDDACVQGDVRGTCEASGACSFPDASCAASGRRYAPLSPGGLGGQCVVPPCGGIDQACCATGPACASPKLTCTSGVCAGCVAQLVAGGAHACALTTDGQARCWGANDHGQLGSGDLADSVAPRAVVDASGVALTEIVELSAGESHTCAVRRDGTLLCWGDGEDGQLGTGPGMTGAANPTPTLVGLTTVAQVAAGGRHTCAALADGRAYCFGANDAGQLGQAGAGATAPEPVTLAGAAQLTTATALAAGDAFTCALDKNGGRLCFGANDSGQLGDGTTLAKSIATPIAGTALALAAGGALLCLLDENHTPRCSGANAFGQTGQPPSPSVLTPMAVAGAAGIATLAVGRDHACARRDDGVVLCWGNDDLGQLGDGKSEARSTPQPIEATAPMGTLAAGRGFACAATAEGVSCWGDDRRGQLGDGLTTSRGTPAPSLLSCP
jgi:alpha-tubulin suppressor-like RCC1 family protein